MMEWRVREWISPPFKWFHKTIRVIPFWAVQQNPYYMFLYGSTLRQWDPMPNENWYSMVACQFGYFMKVPFLKWNNYFKTVRRALTKMHESNTFLAGKSQKELATVESFTKLWVFNRAARVSRFPFACQPPPSKWSRRATRTMCFGDFAIRWWVPKVPSGIYGVDRFVGYLESLQEHDSRWPGRPACE